MFEGLGFRVWFVWGWVCFGARPRPEDKGKGPGVWLWNLVEKLQIMMNCSTSIGLLHCHSLKNVDGPVHHVDPENNASMRTEPPLHM